MWYWTDATEVTLCSFCAYTWPGLWLNKETRSRHCPHLPLLAKKKWHFKPNSFLQQKRWTVWSQEAWQSWQHPQRHMQARTCKQRHAHTLISSICLPWSYVSAIQCLRDLLYSRSERLATAGECHAEAEHANNLLKSFYSSSPSADRFRTAPLGPDEWTCLTE